MIPEWSRIERRIPLLSVLPILAAIVLAVWLLGPSERPAARPAVARIIPPDHDPMCPCCRAQALARQQMTPERAREIAKAAAECAECLRYEGNVPVHPSKR